MIVCVWERAENLWRKAAFEMDLKIRKQSFTWTGFLAGAGSPGTPAERWAAQRETEGGGEGETSSLQEELRRRESIRRLSVAA